MKNWRHFLLQQETVCSRSFFHRINYELICLSSCIFAEFSGRKWLDSGIGVIRANTSDLTLELRVHESFTSYWVAVGEPSHKMGTGPSLVSLAPVFSLSSRNAIPRGAFRDETKNCCGCVRGRLSRNSEDIAYASFSSRLYFLVDQKTVLCCQLL